MTPNSGFLRLAGDHRDTGGIPVISCGLPSCIPVVFRAVFPWSPVVFRTVFPWSAEQYSSEITEDPARPRETMGDHGNTMGDYGISNFTTHPCGRPPQTTADQGGLPLGGNTGRAPHFDLNSLFLLQRRNPLQHTLFGELPCRV